MHVQARRIKLTFPYHEPGKGQYAFYPIRLSCFTEKKRVYQKYQNSIREANCYFLGIFPKPVPPPPSLVHLGIKMSLFGPPKSTILFRNRWTSLPTLLWNIPKKYHFFYCFPITIKPTLKQWYLFGGKGLGKVTFDISPLCSMLVSGFCFILVNVYMPRIRGKPAKKEKKGIGGPPPLPSRYI